MRHLRASLVLCLTAAGLVAATFGQADASRVERTPGAGGPGECSLPARDRADLTHLAFITLTSQAVPARSTGTLDVVSVTSATGVRTSDVTVDGRLWIDDSVVPPLDPPSSPADRAARDGIRRSLDLFGACQSMREFALQFSLYTDEGLRQHFAGNLLNMDVAMLIFERVTPSDNGVAEEPVIRLLSWRPMADDRVAVVIATSAQLGGMGPVPYLVVFRRVDDEWLIDWVLYDARLKSTGAPVETPRAVGGPDHAYDASISSRMVRMSSQRRSLPLTWSSPSNSTSLPITIAMIRVPPGHHQAAIWLAPAKGRVSVSTPWTTSIPQRFPSSI